MDEGLNFLLQSMNVKVVNSIQKSIIDKNIVGWCCKSTSFLRMQHHIGKINKWISDNRIKYVVKIKEDTMFFYIYICNKNKVYEPYTKKSKRTVHL